MSQFFQGVTVGSLPPSVPTQFVTDSGTATPAGNSISVVTPGGGTQGIATSASGSTITITLSETSPQGTGTTPGAVTADLITVTPTNNKSFSVQALVTGYDLANNQMVGGEIIANGRTSSNVVTIVGTPDLTKDSDTGLTSASFTIVASGANFILRVTGVALTTITWKAVLNYITSP